MIETTPRGRVGMLLAAALFAGCAPARPPPLPRAPPPLPAWEAPARALEVSRGTARDRLRALAGDPKPLDNRDGAVTALAALTADATAYETALDGFTAPLLSAAMPLAASERNTTYLDSHRARHRALESALDSLRTAPDAKAIRDAAASAAEVIAAGAAEPVRDASASLVIRSVRRIQPRTGDEPGVWRELESDRLPAEEVPLDLSPVSPEVALFSKSFGAVTPQALATSIAHGFDLAAFHAEALGPGGCLRDRRCSSFDLAELLVDALRAREIPARLAYGTIDADGVSVALRLLGGGDADEALDALAIGGVPAGTQPAPPEKPAPKRKGAALPPAPRTTRIRFEHVWVRAWVGGDWIDLDPSFDASMPARAAPADAIAGTPATDAATLLLRFLSDPSDRTPLGAAMLPARPAPRAAPPLHAADEPAFVIVARGPELASAPAIYRSFVTVTIGSKADAPVVDRRIPLADALATGILFYPRAPSPLDLRITAALAPGHPELLPPHLIPVTTVVSAGGRELAATTPLARGGGVPLTVTLYPPNASPIDVPGWLQSGAPAALTIVPFAPGGGFLRARWHDADVHPESAAGLARAAAATGAELMADLFDETGRLAERANGHRVVSPSAVLVSASFHAPSGLARAPVIDDPSGLTVDVGRFDELLLSRPGADPVAFEVAAGAALSAWEARALRITTGFDAVSTVVASKNAASAGPRPRLLRRVARPADLEGLSFDGRTEIGEALARGFVAIVPRVPQKLGHWMGETYVLLDARSGRGAYLVRGALHGAITTDPAASLLLAVRDGGDASAVLASWRKQRGGRALLAREGWPAGAAITGTGGVDALLAGSSARVSTAVGASIPWPPPGGKARAIELGAPLSLSSMTRPGAALWMGTQTRVLDPEVAALLSKNPPKGFDPKTRLWSGPTALALVGGRLLPIPARY